MAEFSRSDPSVNLGSFTFTWRAILMLCLFAALNSWLVSFCGSVAFWFLMNLAVIAFFTCRTTKRYGTLLNPVAFFAGYYTMAAVVAPAVYSFAGLFIGIDDAAIRRASILSSIYFAALGSTFLFKYSPLEGFFEWLIRVTHKIHIKDVDGKSASLFLVLQFVTLFVLLMAASGVGFMWITNSREAYQFHRASVGVLWSLCQATLLLALVCTLFAWVRKISTLVLVTIPFSVAALFLGSKSQTLAYFVLALFYANLKINRISTKAVLMIGGLLLVGALAAQFQQGTAAGMLDTLLYFDYFRNSAAFLNRFNEFGFHYGTVALSSLWFYVPRALYSAKPFVYGQVQATELLFPGMAEDFGATPGLMQWTAGYSDFGLLGVIAAGLFTGVVAKATFEIFRRRQDVLSASLFAQLGLIYYVDMFPNAPFVVFILWLAVQMVCVRAIRWFWTPVPAPTRAAI